MALQVSPCDPWPVDLDCTNCRNLLGDSPGESPGEAVAALIDKWSRVASEILWAMSGRRWGPCPVSIRPCKRSCMEQSGIITRWGYSGPFFPYIDAGGAWRNATCGCTDDCSCGELCEVYLPGPVYDVVEVRIDGKVVDPATYRVDAAGKLVRQQVVEEALCWPSCQDMSVPAGDVGSFVVTYRWGLPLTAGAIAAASELTCEFLRNCPETAAKDCPCRLPGNVQRVQRQGVTVDVLQETTSIWRQGRTGLPLVDAWLAAVNPYGLTAPPRVYSPDVRRPRVQVWP